jgi:hypothetical protein
MARKQLVIFVLAPIGIMVAYALSRWLLPVDSQAILSDENGIVELATAVGFAAAGGVAFGLWRRTRGRAPGPCRAFYLLCAIVGALIACEELSWGQHLFNWSTPELFATNDHGETNLHNMFGNRPSHWLKDAGNVGSVLAFVIVPAIAMLRRGQYPAGHWTHYLLPRWELMTMVALAQLSQAIWDIPKPIIGEFWHEGWNELREFYWGLSFAAYAAILRHRLDAAGDSRLGSSHDASYSHIDRRAA